MTRSLAVSLAVAGLASAPAAAQLCAGSASFSRSHVQLTASAEFNTDANVFGGGLAVGGRGPFLEVVGGRANYELGGSVSAFGAGTGYQFALDPKGEFHLCPLLSLTHQSGPHDFDVFNNGIIWDRDGNTYALGFGIGGAAKLSSNVKFLPFGSLSMVTSKIKLHNQTLGQTQNTTETGSLIEFGFGMLFNEAFSIRPSLGFTTTTSRTVTAFGVSMTVNFGR